MGFCLPNVPDTVNGGFDRTLSGNYEYACNGNKYIDMRTSTARCIDEGECKGVINEALQICINYQDHTVYPYSCYIYFDGVTIKCIYASKCDQI